MESESAVRRRLGLHSVFSQHFKLGNIRHVFGPDELHKARAYAHSMAPRFPEHHFTIVHHHSGRVVERIPARALAGRRLAAEYRR